VRLEQDRIRALRNLESTFVWFCDRGLNNFRRAIPLMPGCAVRCVKSRSGSQPRIETVRLRADRGNPPQIPWHLGQDIPQWVQPRRQRDRQVLGGAGETTARTSNFFCRVLFSCAGAWRSGRRSQGRRIRRSYFFLALPPFSAAEAEEAGSFLCCLLFRSPKPKKLVLSRAASFFGRLVARGSRGLAAALYVFLAGLTSGKVLGWGRDQRK